MENKDYFERTYKVNFDCALKYVQQKNWSEARKSLEKAGEALVKLVPLTYGTEKEKYLAKVNALTDLLKDVRAREDSEKKPVQAAGGGNKPAANNTSNQNKKEEATEEKPVEKVSVEEALNELYELEGLAVVKQQVKKYVDLMRTFQKRKEAGLPVPPVSYHMVFLGNPGTGKTTVARIMAKIFNALGIVEKGHLVEVARKDLVAGYVGQTAIQTQKVIEKAIGGVLFIDEAYTLAPKKGGGNDFGQEAIDTLLAEMENRRSEFVVVVAGYDDLMADFIDSNPGLQSRFKNYLNFTDYNGEELYRIFSKMCEKNKYVPSAQAREAIKAKLYDLYEHRGPNFANARDAHKMFENTIENQATRMATMSNPSNDDLMTILPEDIK